MIRKRLFRQLFTARRQIDTALAEVERETDPVRSQEIQLDLDRARRQLDALQMRVQAIEGDQR